MLVHVKRDELLAIAAQTAKAAPKTATSEAVLGIHVEADSRRSMLTLTATNYEIVIRASMGASVEQSGSVVISAALFPAAIPAGSPQISGPARTAQVQLFHHCLPGHELRCPPLQGVLDAQEAPCPGRVPG